MIPVNDGPILQFSGIADPLRFAPLQNRIHSLGYREEDHPVVLLPDSATLADVDSLQVAGATVTILGIRERGKEKLLVNSLLAESLGISVTWNETSANSITLILRGLATIGNYKQVFDLQIS